jgi:hypothetical protein
LGVDERRSTLIEKKRMPYLSSSPFIGGQKAFFFFRNLLRNRDAEWAFGIGLFSFAIVAPLRERSSLAPQTQNPQRIPR